MLAARRRANHKTRSLCYGKSA